MTGSHSKVFFITDSPRFDLTSAEEFGHPVFLLRDREISPFNVDALMERIDDRLIEEEFEIDNDYIAITGPAAIVALFLGFLGSIRRPVKLLMFNASQGKYQARIMDTQMGSRTLPHGEG